MIGGEKSGMLSQSKKECVFELTFQKSLFQGGNLVIESPMNYPIIDTTSHLQTLWAGPSQNNENMMDGLSSMADDELVYEEGGEVEQENGLSLAVHENLLGARVDTDDALVCMDHARKGKMEQRKKVGTCLKRRTHDGKLRVQVTSNQGKDSFKGIGKGKRIKTEVLAKLLREQIFPDCIILSNSKLTLTDQDNEISAAGPSVGFPRRMP